MQLLSFKNGKCSWCGQTDQLNKGHTQCKQSKQKSLETDTGKALYPNVYKVAQGGAL